MERIGKTLVAGGGGFIGGHLVRSLLWERHSDIRVVDCKPLREWHQVFPEADNICPDLKRLRRRYKLTAPTGVRERNSDNTLITQRLGWAPAIPLETGLEQTYRWIYDQMTVGRRDVFH
jgi:nucleoside-diphosphate-sugar epimerase